MRRCRSVLLWSVDGEPVAKEQCSLDAGHDDCHAVIEDGVEILIWCDDGDYSGSRGQRLIQTQIQTRFRDQLNQ